MRHFLMEGNGMASYTKSLNALVLSLILAPAALASVDDINSSTEGRPYSRVNDRFPATANNPGYQTNSIGQQYSPRIRLDNASGDISNAIGSPAIDLANATGDISGTTGINNTIRDNMGSATWKRLYSFARPFQGTLNIPSNAQFITIKYRVGYNGANKHQWAGLEWSRGHRSIGACTTARDILLFNNSPSTRQYGIGNSVNDISIDLNAMQMGGRFVIAERTMSGHSVARQVVVLNGYSLWAGDGSYYYWPASNGSEWFCVSAGIISVDVFN